MLDKILIICYTAQLIQKARKCMSFMHIAVNNGCMYNIIVSGLLILSTLLPIGAIAGDVEQSPQFDENIDNIIYDVENSKVYQVDGNSMDPLGFADGDFIDVMTASELQIGDVIAFECSRDACDGAYIKRIVQKQGSCFWVEGRDDIWEENGKKKQSMDSRTTYGWLCNDDIKIYGVAFPQKA